MSAVMAHVDSLTDQERERAIQRAGDLMLKRYSEFAATRSESALNDAYEALQIQKRLIEGRSWNQVRRLECRKGLV